MMTSEQRKVVVQAYGHLMDTEKRGWDGLDDYLEHLEYLEEDQLHREADVIYEKHRGNNVGCQQKHPKEKCFIPVLIEAVAAILELYKEKNVMHPKNRYILQYYLAMNQANMIVIEDRPSVS